MQFGLTALIKAAEFGHLGIVNLLIKAGANLNAQNNVGGWNTEYEHGKHG